MIHPDEAGPDEAPDVSEAPDIPGRTQKSPTAFRTISEVADDLHIPQHVLRFWETKFPQVRPLKRGGGRRYYRPDDIALLRRISDLLYIQGYTIKGVQRLLRDGDPMEDAPTAAEDPIEAGEAEAATAPSPAPDESAASPFVSVETPDAPPARLHAVLGRVLRELEGLRAELG